MKIVISIIISSVLLLSTFILSEPSNLKISIPESDIIFSHKFHVEQDIECEMCHISINESNSSSDKNLPTMDECANCHEVEDDENCGICHKNTDDLSGLVNPDREIIFSHSLHINMDLSCDKCHGNIAESEETNLKYMPSKATCYACHDNSKASQSCNICHSSGISVFDIHPIGWENTHGEQAVVNEGFCANCHNQESFCIDCHRGDNKTGNIHDLNYFFTHGLDAKSNQKDCQRCHNNNQFCVTCHEQGMRLPLNHSKLNWLLDHGQAAKTDVENCAVCHETSDPTCARAGCHSDFDGIRGTDPQIHSSNNGLFQSEGPWHGDDGYYCFQCHVTSRNLPTGFCGYCHTDNGGD